ncbi:MAG: NAD(+)/NADH kinase [Ilumatobacteraceae bacterium]
MTDVLLVGHHGRAEVATLAREAAAWLTARGHRAWMTADDADALDLDDLLAELPPPSAGLAISLGGDGTMLRTLQILEDAPVPIIGVNLGWLGYLTEVEPHGLADALDRWFAGPAAGRWNIDERMMLEVTLRRGGAADPVGRWTALNEGVVERRESGHTIRFLVRIDGEVFTSYAADGLIVATPTGSTAYSLSAHGPVVSPRHRALLVTPVAAHMLFDRSLVLDPEESVEIEVLGARPATLSIDGQVAASLDAGDVVAVGPASNPPRFVRFSERRFHQILKAKFGLADR